MAKKSDKTIQDYTFDNLVSSLKKVNPNAEILSKSDFGTIKEYIHTGNYMLNALISGSIMRGVPAGKITTLAGDSGTGKTFLSLNIAANAQKQGYKVVYFDTECGMLGREPSSDLIDENGDFDKSKVSAFGVDADNFLHVPVSTIESLSFETITIINNAIDAKRAGKSYPKVLLILDSLGMLSTNKTLTDMSAGSETKDMTRAGKIRNYFQAITVSLGELDWPYLITNHVISNIGGYGAAKVQVGGTGAMFTPTTVVMLNKQKEKEGTRQVGINVTAKTDVKNRLAHPGEINFQIRFKEGMNPYLGLENYINYELCGIGRGKWDKNEYVKDNGRTIAVEHLQKHFSKASEIFTPEVFTEDVLRKLDSVISKEFEYGGDVDSETYDLD